MGRNDARIVPISIRDMDLKASRPQFSALANDKLRQIAEMPTWQQALRRHLDSRRTTRAGTLGA